MSTWKKCDDTVGKLAKELIQKFKTHEPLLRAGVLVDFVFAFADIDETTQEPIGCALKLHGYKALGICRKIGLKDRAMGRGDAEISLDGDWWREASEEERAALLDHELHHIAIREIDGKIIRDDLNRPKLDLRKHDVDIGWFNLIAERHKQHSQERIQAKTILSAYGQYYWPDIVAAQPKRKAA